VRDFEVIDAFPFGIQFSWERDGEQTTTVLFERNGPIPAAKMLTFFRCAACSRVCCSGTGSVVSMPSVSACDRSLLGSL